jgi:hypothetical protein
MTAANSIVKNDGASTARITGSVNPAIKCNGYAGSRVTGITFDDILGDSSSGAGDGVVNCAKVDENVFAYSASTGTAIKSSGVASTDFTRDNYVYYWMKGIVITGTQPLTVENNLIAMRNYGTESNIKGVDVSGFTGSSGLIVRNNVVFGSYGTGITGDSGATLSANYCDPTNTVGDCSMPHPPFTLP